MITINFTEEDVEAFDYERYHHPHPRVQRKMEALWFKSQGLPYHQITRLTGISPNTLRAYLRQYLTGGIDALKHLNYTPQESELMAHQTTIEDYFRANPPATIKRVDNECDSKSLKEAVAKIYELTGIQRSESCVREFFKKIGIEYRSKAGVSMFHSQYWQPSVSLALAVACLSCIRVASTHHRKGYDSH